jgi:phosphoglycolate phosphatase
VKAVVFDLDGTIIDFNIDYKAVRAEVRNFLISEGLPQCLFSLNESIFEMLEKAEISMRNNGESENKIKKLRKKAFQIAEKLELEAAHITNLLPGVTEILKTLRNMKLKMGISTINSRKCTSYVLERFGISHFFDAVVTRDDVPEVKPNPVHVEIALKTLNVKASEALMVGDWIGDIKAAGELGLITVGFPTGFATAKQLIDAGANYIITSLIDLPTLIQQINKNDVK